MSNSITKDVLSKNMTYTKYITDEGLRSALDDILMKYSTKEKLEEAERISRIMVAMFIKQKVMTEQFTSGAVQPLVAAAFLSNIFYDEKEPVASIFKARDVFKPMLEKNDEIMEAWIELIFQTIEGQLGADTPVPACTPHGDHPINIFAWARWFVKECPGI